MIFLLFFWTQPECISNLDIACRTPDAEIDRFGRMHVVWYAGDEFNDWDVYYSRSDNGGWLPTEMIWDAVLGVSDTKVSVDTLGNPHLLWIDWISDAVAKLYYMYHSGTEWIGPVDLSDSLSIPNTGTCDIAVDKNSIVHIVWSDTRIGNKEICYSKNYGDGWTSPLNISNLSGDDKFPRMALCNNRIFVVWEDEPGEKDVFLAQFNGSQWLAPENVSQTPGVSSRSPAVSVGKYHIPMVAWQESVDMYPYFNRYPWADTSRVWSDIGTWPDVATDTFDIPHVVATGGDPPVVDPELRYATLTDTGWVYEVLPIGELWEPTHPVVIIDSSNVVHIVFKAKHLSDPDIDIYYMRSDGGGGISEDLNTDDTVISYNGKIYINPNENGVYEVYDLTGKVIKRGSFVSGESYIILKGIPTGTYFIRIGRERLRKILLLK